MDKNLDNVMKARKLVIVNYLKKSKKCGIQSQI